MNKLILIGLLFLCKLSILAQNKIITGKITDSIGEPLPLVRIYQINTNYSTHTDFDGLFHLLINEKKQLRVNRIGYKPMAISNLDTINGLLKIQLPVDSTNTKQEGNFPKKNSNFGFFSYFQIDFFPYNFNDFKSLLKDYNVKLMNTQNSTVNLEFAGTYKKYYVGLSFGFSRRDDINKINSLKIKFNKTQYGLNLGYRILNTRRLLLIPKFAIKWDRFRLLNSNQEYKIPLSKYLTEKDLDLRFNQIIGVLGINISYKMYSYGLLASDYWTIGMYGGYAFKTHPTPWVYSKGNRLTTNKKITIENYNIGCYLSFNLE